MVTRRTALRLAAAGLAGTAGCLGGPSTGSRTASPAPVPDDTATPGPPDGDEPTASSTPSAQDLEDWDVAWELPIDYEHALGLDVADGVLLATLSEEGGPSAVAAVDPATPAVDWEAELDGEAVGGADARDDWGVLVAGDAVYAVAGHAETYDWTALHALDRATGERRWSVRRDRELTVRGVVDGLVVASGLEFFEPDHTHDTPEEPLTTVVYGLDAADGDVRWTAAFDGVVDVTAGSEGVYVAAGSRLVGLGLDGSGRFEYPGDRHPGRAVRARQGRVYYLTAPGHDRSVVHGLDASGDRAWRLDLPVHEVLLDGDRLYAGGQSVLALDPDGSVAWRDDSGFGQDLLLGPGGETLFTRAGRALDRAAAYRTADGTRRWTYRPPTLSSPNAWPVAATADSAVVEGITADHATEPFTTLFAVDRASGRGTRSFATDPVFDVEAVGGTFAVAGSSLWGLES